MLFWRKKEPITFEQAQEQLKARDKPLWRDVQDSIKRHRKFGDPAAVFASEPRYGRFWAGGNFNSDDEIGEIFERELARIFGDDAHPDAKVERRRGAYALRLRDGRELIASISLK